MAGSNRTIIGIFIVLLAVIAIVVAWLLLRGSGEAPPPGPVQGVVDTALPEPSPTPPLAQRLSERLAGTTLGTSDAVVRELVASLSANPKLAAWLANEDLIRRFTASVDNIAAGISPRAHLEFARPRQGFQVDERADGIVVIDPASYRRYDTVAQVVESIDTPGAVALYLELEPLIDDAYAEIGPPRTDFDDRLQAAFDQLLAVPVLEGPAEVEPLVVTYAWADDELEALSGAQRHLLRMGPDNVAAIQNKLGEIRAALAAIRTEDR
jgi:hypothetical protein